MILIIDTAKEKKIFFGLIKEKNFLAKKVIPLPNRKSEVLLLALDKFFQAAKIRPKFLSGLAVVSGPGPFTSLRLGVVTANTLAWALKIPVIGIKASEFSNLIQLAQVIKQRLNSLAREEIIEPFYGKEPNITIKHVVSIGLL
jgi:tRNA A37 threonylcarbamoyladenosine modification protein TsaB